MIGIDLCFIERFSNKKEEFFKKFLSPKEIQDFQKTTNKELFLATRWAIKEAMFKANNQFVNFSKITIEKKQGEYFHPYFEISTSKENGMLIAIVLWKEHYD